MSYWDVDYDAAVTKLKAGEKLTEDEIATICYNSHEVDEIEGDDHRWAREVTTIVQIDDSENLWAIDWMRGLTEYQENEFYDQPYKVKKVEKVVTKVEVSYERV